MIAPDLSPAEIYAANMMFNFPAFAEEKLLIRPKEIDQGLVPFSLRPAQHYLDRAAEDMIDRKGWVRLLVVKGRQLGSSTYVGGRFYWKTTRNNGTRAYILCHDQEGTDNLFEMTHRYHENDPDGPATNRASAKEIAFAENGSSYKVGTAGSKSIGRGQTIQYFHGSEVAFWPNAENHIRGVLQAVPKSPGTEIWLETTGDGPQGVYYEMVKAALEGKGDFEVVFVAWWLDPGYEADPPENWDVPDEFELYREHNGLTLEQTYWAYLKNAELANSLGLPVDQICWMFRREYPQNIAEAFQTSSDNCFIEPNLCLAARKRDVVQPTQLPLVLGVDPFEGGPDRLAMISRRGREAGKLVFGVSDEHRTMEVAKIIINLHLTYGFARVFIDKGGGGKQIADVVEALGYPELITVVNFGSQASDKARFANKRAEMWWHMREWFRDEVSIPDDDELQAALTSPEWGPGATVEKPNGQLLLEPKEHIRKRTGKSPDSADALALTFAMPISMESIANVSARAKRGDRHTGY